MNKANLIRNEIFKKIEMLYDCEHKPKRYIPGVSNIPYAGRVYDASDIISLVDASLDFWLTSGRFARELESKLPHFLGVKYGLLTNSGSSANLLAVSALTSALLGSKRLKPGDEVITTACGFPTTLNPILQNNLVPVFVDIELGTYNPSILSIKKAISKKTRAIFLPHTLGNPCCMEEIMELAHKHKLWVIEDNCDALGSEYKNKYTGSFGHISTLSFYPAHHMTMGEGGAVLTQDLSLRKIIASYRDWGRDCWCDPGVDNSCKKRFHWKAGRLPYGYDHKYIYSHIGYNLKATDMQAAIGCAQLKKLPAFIKKRKINFDFLYSKLRQFDKYLLMPQATPNSNPSWFGFPILVKQNNSFSRREIVLFLEKNKIATRMIFGGNLLRQPAYSHIKARISDNLKNTDIAMNDLFWIGVYPGISNPMLKYTVDIFNNFFKSLHNKKL